MASKADLQKLIEDESNRRYAAVVPSEGAINTAKKDLVNLREAEAKQLTAAARRALRPLNIQLGPHFVVSPHHPRSFHRGISVSTDTGKSFQQSTLILQLEKTRAKTVEVCRKDYLALRTRLMLDGPTPEVVQAVREYIHA